MPEYESLRGEWRHDPLNWWLAQTDRVDWKTPPRTVRDDAVGPHGAWFPDGMVNTSYNCLDRHVLGGCGERVALIWDSPLAGEKRQYTYAALLDAVSRFAGALASEGVTKGDRVLIYMPMVPEAVIAMLATARLGAIHSVVFGGFAAPELAKRINDAAPRVIVTASCGLEPSRVINYKELLDEAIGLSGHRSDRCFVLQRHALPARMTDQDRDFATALAESAPVPATAVQSSAPLYILYTSGTTGKPKGVVRDHGGYCTALLASMKHIYGARAGDVFWAASDIGWVVGHSYIVYAPLLMGCTTVLYEGKPVGTPDAGAFWRVCAEYGVRILFTAPTAIRAIRKDDPTGSLMNAYDVGKLDAIFLAGERCDPPTATWLAKATARPVVDHWWQTETGWPVTTGFRGVTGFEQPVGSAGRAAPGWNVAVFDGERITLEEGGIGDLAIGLPLPPGAAVTLWNDDAGFRAAYLDDHPGWYATGDAGRIDADGNVWVMGRTDDVINVAGHRLSTGAMEEIIAAHVEIVECAVIGIPDALKGEVPLALVVRQKRSTASDEDVVRDIVQLVRDRIGAVAVFKHAIVVAKLPKTRSGKIIRRSMRDAAAGVDRPAPATIEDKSVLDSVSNAIRAFVAQHPVR